MDVGVVLRFEVQLLCELITNDEDVYHTGESYGIQFSSLVSTGVSMGAFRYR